jgi:PilZ domain-containing protein
MFARHRCNGGAEVRREPAPNNERVWGRITQLSLGGCYVAAMHPFAPQTKVALFLGVQDVEVRAKGVVCRSQPGVGMGIMFTELDEHNQRGLEILTAELAKGGRYSQFA